jgi:hypothetical protein
VKDKGFLRLRNEAEGWLVDLDAVDEQELTELITDSWRQKAPKRVLQAYEASVETGGDR